MKEENTRIDDLLDINIAKEVEKRETARMDASFKERVAAGIKETAVPALEKKPDRRRYLNLPSYPAYCFSLNSSPSDEQCHYIQLFFSMSIAGFSLI